MAPRTDTTSTMPTSVIVILLVMAIGAVIFLRKGGYMRRQTMLVAFGVILLALVAIGYWMLFYHPAEY